MALKVDAKSDKHWEIVLEDEDVGVASMIVAELLKDPDVEFASAVVDHPVVARSPRLVVKTKSKKVKDALNRALGKLIDQVGDLKAKLKRLKEK